MPDPTPPPEKPYTLSLEGTALTLRDFMEVPHTALRMIEERIGAPERVVACYQAWSIQLDQGLRWMTEAQIANARIWSQVWEQASEAARAQLSAPHSSSLVFRLR